MAMQEREKKMIIILVLLALGYGIYATVTMIKPKFDEMQKETIELKQRFKTAEINARKLSQLEKRRQVVREQIELAKEKLPEIKQIKALYNEFSQLLMQSRIRPDQVESLQAQAQRLESFYITQPYSISMACSFESLCLFLNELYNYPRLIDVISLPLGISLDEKEGANVRIVLTVNTYLYRENTEGE